MFLNCACIVNTYAETVGYLVVRGADKYTNPIELPWEYVPVDQYDNLFEESPCEVFVLWSDTDVTQYRYAYQSDDFGKSDTSYTYLRIDETLYRKTFHNKNSVLLLPQAIFYHRGKAYFTITAIGSNIAGYSEYVNRLYPTLPQSMYTVRGGVFRFVITDKDLLSKKLLTDKFYSFISTLCIMQHMAKPYWKTNVKGYTAVNRDYCKSVMNRLDDFTDQFILPDLSDYVNILSYQSMMGLNAEQMSLELERLETLYNTKSLQELDECLASKV